MKKDLDKFQKNQKKIFRMALSLFLIAVASIICGIAINSPVSKGGKSSSSDPKNYYGTYVANYASYEYSVEIQKNYATLSTTNQNDYSFRLSYAEYNYYDSKDLNRYFNLDGTYPGIAIWNDSSKEQAHIFRIIDRYTISYGTTNTLLFIKEGREEPSTSTPEWTYPAESTPEWTNPVESTPEWTYPVTSEPSISDSELIGNPTDMDYDYCGHFACFRADSSDEYFYVYQVSIYYDCVNIMEYDSNGDLYVDEYYDYTYYECIYQNDFEAYLICKSQSDSSKEIIIYLYSYYIINYAGRTYEYFE